MQFGLFLSSVIFLSKVTYVKHDLNSFPKALIQNVGPEAHFVPHPGGHETQPFSPLCLSQPAVLVGSGSWTHLLVACWVSFGLSVEVSPFIFTAPHHWDAVVFHFLAGLSPDHTVNFKEFHHLLATPYTTHTHTHTCVKTHMNTEIESCLLYSSLATIPSIHPFLFPSVVPVDEWLICIHALGGCF